MRMNVPFIPKNPDVGLRVIVMGRLSKAKETPEQSQLAIESSYKPAEEFLANVYQGPMEIQYLGEQVSGMIAARATMSKFWELVNSGEWDVVIAEDLSRFYRNPQLQMAFVQDCYDADIRCICVADNLDTADENWETMLSLATVRHGFQVPDTRRRIKRQAKYSFEQGGMVLREKYGYRKLSREEAASGQFGPKGLREAKRPECTAILHSIRQLALEGKSATDISAWLMENNVPTGKYVKDGWKLYVLKDLLRDPKLHGWRYFRRVIHKPIMRTGAYKRLHNETPEKYHVPELAHMTLDEQQSMLDALGWKMNWNNIRSGKKSPRLGVSRKRSLWPGQAAKCAECGGTMLNMGKYLKCANSLKAFGQTCWNHVQVSIEVTRQLVISWLTEKFHTYPAAREIVIDAAWKEFEHNRESVSKNDRSRNQERKLLEGQQECLATAIADGGEMQVLLRKLKDVVKKLKDLSKTEAMESAGNKHLTKFDSREKIAAEIDKVLAILISTSFDFADVMRRMFPSFVIKPVQTYDSGQIRPRGKLGFQIPTAETNSPANDEFVEISFNLFKIPDRIAFVPKVIEARSRTPQPSYRLIAIELDVHEMTVKRAASYIRLMEKLGTTDLFRETSGEPNNAARWRSGKTRKHRRKKDGEEPPPNMQAM